VVTLLSVALLLFAGEVALVVHNLLIAAREARRPGGPGGAIG
jgi:hypothetical protein